MMHGQLQQPNFGRRRYHFLMLPALSQHPLVAQRRLSDPGIYGDGRATDPDLHKGSLIARGARKARQDKWLLHDRRDKIMEITAY